MRRIGVVVLAAVCACARVRPRQRACAGVLLEYLTGDADAAVVKVSTLDHEEILLG